MDYTFEMFFFVVLNKNVDLGNVPNLCLNKMKALKTHHTNKLIKLWCQNPTNKSILPDEYNIS